MKRISAIFAAALCVAAAGAAKAADSLTMANFAHSVKLMVSGYAGTEELEDFPVLVRVSEAGLDGFRYADMSAKNTNGTALGYDLAFFAEDGTRLASENDTWDASGESLVWVKLPRMRNGTKFHMCYNVADGVMVENANPWGDYAGVWHLNEKGGSGKPVYDATTNALNGTIRASGTSVGIVADGMVGASRRIAADRNNAYGIVVNASDGTQKAAADSLGTDFSASFWMRWKGDTAYSFLVDRRKGEQGNSWGVRLHAAGTKQLQIYAAGEKPFSNNYDGTLTGANYAALYTANVWNKVDIHWRHATNNGQPAADVYLNGAFVETVALPNPAAQAAANIGIGGSTQDSPSDSGAGKGRRFNGDMDEVRLRRGVSSADRVKADYDTVSNSRFVTVAPPDNLAVSWANASGDAPGVVATTRAGATFGGSVLSLGDADSACEIQCKVWRAADESEPAGWTTLTNGLAAGESFSAPVSGLEKGTAYAYKLRAAGASGAETDAIQGEFSTDPGLVVAWDGDAATPGISRVAPDFAIAGGRVASIDAAETCGVSGKVWPVGEAEPADWTAIASGLAAGDSFGTLFSDLLPGTDYRYALRADGSAGLDTAIASGAFKTKGEAGETIGSPYTHFFDDGTNACWVANDFERYLPFTVTGYAGSETLTNFPVLVEVRKSDTNGFSYGDFYHYDGSDIAFVDEKGRIIPHEIDTWNKNGMSLFWVRLPEMRNGTTFTMCYRSPMLRTPPDPGNTFERYVGVWHMNEQTDGVAELKDSTANNLTAETHALSTADKNGRIGYARRVAQQPGSSASYGRIIAFDHDDILRTGVGNVFTYSGWYKLAATPPKWAYLVSRKSEDADKGWGIQYGETFSAQSPQLRVWAGSTTKNSFQLFGAPGASATGWNYWTFVFDGSVNPDGTTNQLFYAYLNGNELPASSTNGGFRLNYPVVNDENADYDHLCVVGQQNGTGAFNGLVDEARYSKGARSADWIRAEYDSTLQQVYWNDAGRRFVTKADHVSHGVDSLVPVVVWEHGAGLPDTILDVSYAYVQFAGTVTYCGAGATECRIEYQLWPDGEDQPEGWTTLRSGLRAGNEFSIPVTGLKQDMLYNFSIRAVNEVDGEERQNHEHAGQFRTHGNMSLGDVDGELFRVGDRFVHRYRAGHWEFKTPDYVTNVEIMVVGGGGAGGYKVGGGGGGGGLFHSASFPVATNTVYHVAVGRGGNAPSDLGTESAEGNGEHSYFALANDAGNPLVLVPGGGGGGSYIATAAVATGAAGGSGGGGTYAMPGGGAVSNEVEGVWTRFGNAGGRGNDAFSGGSKGKVAAGGGGGAGRAGLGATFDAWSAGGAGGVGVGNAMTGEMLYYGAGGGGGYVYRTETVKDGSVNFTKPGGGGSGIGGNAADVRNGTPATSGVENTGAGGGGGSSRGIGAEGTVPDESDRTYWKGGDGGDGVVLISYEAHGRDPISEEPRITMASCEYISKETVANIHYRAYWAGIQAQTNDVYVLYSTVGADDVAAGNGEMVKAAEDTIGIGNTTFRPPSVGYTYWIRLVARKDANSFMYSDEIATFEVPAVEANGTDPKMPDENDASKDHAIVNYNLFDTAPDARLYCYWSENRADLEGDSAPSGTSVRFLDLGTGRAGEAREFTIAAEDGIERNKTYYVRLATGNEAGTKYFLSKQIILLEMIDKPRVIFDEGSWFNHRATVDFLETTAYLDPADVELLALYSGEKAVFEADPAATNLIDRPGVLVANLGSCAFYPDDAETSTQFPMWSPVNTNFYVRLALATNGVPVCYSQRYHTLTAITAVPTNTLLVYVNADAKIGCYGDEPQPLTYATSYGGRTEGPGWDHWTSSGSRFEGGLGCDVSLLSPSGQYDIGQGSLVLGNGGQTYFDDEPVIDPETGLPAVDGNGDPVTTPVPYYYELIVTGSKYTVTNAQFTAAIADASTVYTGEDFNPTNLVVSTNGVRNAQPVTFRYRVGTDDWTDTIATTYSDIWTHIIQFKASAPNHDDARGTFMITVEPAPLSATISAPGAAYTGAPQIPAVSTNVTGLVRGDLNPLLCEFREEAGEWQSEVPAFEKPGEYRLFFRVSAPNHATFTTNCTFVIEAWDYRVNMDGASGYGTPIQISDPAWLLRATGWSGERFAVPGDRYAKLDEIQPNGLRLWQNYVIDRTDLGRKLVSAVRQSGDRVNANSFVTYFPGVEALRNTGLSVHFRLDRKLRGETDFTRGELTDKYETNVPLGPGDPTGLYVFNIVLTPTNSLLTGESVLASAATVGVLRVTGSLTNTVAAVPWMSMARADEANENVRVSDAVNPNGISPGDLIVAYEPVSGEFAGWSHESGTDWNALATVTTNGVSFRPAETSAFAPGGAFWLVRSNPAETPWFHLVGRHVGGTRTVDIAPGTAAAPGSTLCANPTGNAIDLGELAFSGAIGADDTIVFNGNGAVSTVYVRDSSNAAWGRYVPTRVGRKIVNTFVPGGRVAPGTGFWYVRRSGEPLSLVWPAWSAD